jgi:hypothetical protein
VIKNPMGPDAGARVVQAVTKATPATALKVNVIRFSIKISRWLWVLRRLKISIQVLLAIVNERIQHKICQALDAVQYFDTCL